VKKLSRLAVAGYKQVTGSTLIERLTHKAIDLQDIKAKNTTALHR